MKNRLVYLLGVLLAVTSCYREESNQRERAKTIRVNIVVDELETGVKTRAIIKAEPDERRLNTLYLAFFDYDKNGNGGYIGYHQVANPATLQMTSTLAISTTLDNGATINDAQDYTLLAFANIDTYTDNVDDFLADFINHDEKSALQKIVAGVSGSGTDETDNSHAIESGKLLMSARAVRMAGEAVTTIQLKRGVSRFDVRNETVTHTLASVSIWGATAETTVWEGAPFQYKTMQRFYGVTPDSGKEEIVGKLYAFENSVLEPASNDRETTCLVIGLQSTSDPDKVLFYRANINLTDAAQNLKRNHSYLISVISVTGEGSNTEYEAWTQSRNQLIVSINNWNLDDNGMILTDGTNALGLTVKRITFDPRGDIREYSLYTSGTGQLEITRADLPLEDDNTTPAFTAVIEGNMLKVTATPLPVTKERRRGSIEVSFAGLRGSISMIQEPMNEKLLRLDRATIPEFDAVGRNGIADGPLVVTASGPWVAEIYNVDRTPGNPGFSFTQGGDALVRLDSETNPLGDRFQIYTTGDNPYPNDQRAGFMIVSLVEDPDNFSVAVPLVQNVKPVFEVLPSVKEVRFTADMNPVNTAIAVGKTYEFTVNSGLATWDVELSGGDNNKFELTKVAAQNKFVVKVNEMNQTATAYTSTIRVTTSDGKEIMIPLIQEIPVISVDFSGEVPAAGGYVNLDVSSTNMPWDAEIVENWESGSSTSQHKGWLETVNDATQVSAITAHPANGAFKVGFNALNFPLVNMTPKVSIKVSISGVPQISQTVEVIQLPLKPGVLKVMDVRHDSYGSLGGGGSYFNGYNDFLRSSTLFGPSGIVKVPAISITEVNRRDDPGEISSDYRYVHAGGNPKHYDSSRFTSVENWRIANDGIVVYASDSEGDQFTNTNSTLVILGYVPADRVYRQPASINTALLTGGDNRARNIMNYLLSDGPFGAVNNPEDLSFSMDGTCVSVKSYPAGAVPVMINGDGNALVVFDPDNRMVYIGEGQMFHNGYNAGIRNDKDRFLANLISYVVNAAMNGSAFTEIFKDDNRYNEKFK